MASFAWFEFFVGGFISFIITGLGLTSAPVVNASFEKRVAEAYEQGFRKGVSLLEEKVSK